jgi:DNA-binding response OmpR family regulator
MKILVVEDDARIAEFLQRGLKPRGFQVDIARDGKEGLEKGPMSVYRLIILDRRLPLVSGLQMCRQLRGQGVSTPILMLTALDSTQDVVAGLRAGADDYLTKPFSFDVLMARIDALLRRSPTLARATEQLRVADLTVDRVAGEAWRGDRRLDLTPREFGLLAYLLESKGQVVSKAQIHEHVWGYQADPLTNVVAVVMRHLRRKVDENAATKLIHTRRGFGYFVGERANRSAPAGPALRVVK